MNVHDFIARLKVRSSGDGNWRCDCPCGHSSTGALSVTDRDGKLLLHCFAGCDVAGVLAAMGLSVGDLFADDHRHDRLDDPVARVERIYRKLTGEDVAKLLRACDIARFALDGVIHGVGFTGHDMGIIAQTSTEVMRIAEELGCLEKLLSRTRREMTAQLKDGWPKSVVN